VSLAFLAGLASAAIIFWPLYALAGLLGIRREQLRIPGQPSKPCVTSSARGEQLTHCRSIQTLANVCHGCC
jgi:hypothetical protein